MRALIIIIFLAGGLYGAYHYITSGSGGGMPQMGPTPVSVAQVIVRDIGQWDEFSGRLEAVEHVEIRPRVGGTVDRIHFAEGQMVG